MRKLPNAPKVRAGPGGFSMLCRRVTVIGSIYDLMRDNQNGNF